jgi:glycosyltransferase involved in cell wall biosynthesis
MKILWVGDAGVTSGFGRIANEVCSRLVQRGHQVHAVSILWDGVMTEGVDWYSTQNHKYPFRISGVAGRDIYAYIYNLINLARPDIVVVCQDFPYLVTTYYNLRIDWSRVSFCGITPIDGEPIFEDWLRLVDDTDGAMVISQFGVDAMKRAGRRVELCAPGIDSHYFKPATPEEKSALRSRAAIPQDAFVLGMMAMNQGRKDIPHTLDGFAKFAIDKPNAYLLLDMDKVNPAGWNIPSLMKTKNIPENKVIFKEDLVKRGINEYRDRLCLLDAHSVLAHREGFGLPLIESQACMIPTIAMDWCSGTEICGNGQGYLVNPLPQPRNSTWGNAFDFDVDVNSFVGVLEAIYQNPIGAKAIAKRGYDWVIQRTWDKTADAVEQLFLSIEAKKKPKTDPNVEVVKAAMEQLK